uniref:Uncharacterized protein n=1 Tax=Rhizophora mucronata TaxID=61149 RepID=A0A2P2NVG9_RHIMU
MFFCFLYISSMQFHIFALLFSHSFVLLTGHCVV